MRVVGGAEAAAALERVAEAEPLDRGRRDGEADEGEPGDPGQDVDRAQRRERRVDEERDKHRRSCRRTVVHELDRPEVRGDEERRGEPEDDHLHVDRRTVQVHLVDERKWQP